MEPRMRPSPLLAFGLAALSATGVCVAADAVRLPVTPFATLPSDASSGKPGCRSRDR